MSHEREVYVCVGISGLGGNGRWRGIDRLLEGNR
jgi:hypothetical protein